MTKYISEKTLQITTTSSATSSGTMAAVDTVVACARRASANQEQAVVEHRARRVAIPPPPPLRSRLQQRRTELEQLLDVDLDDLQVGTRRLPNEDNQQLADEDAALQNVSLELLALLSPHGTTQQWEEDYDEKTEFEQHEPQIPHRKPQKFLNPADHRSHQYVVSDLTSPTESMTAFAPSPIHSADGDEFDLSSPVALPDEPQSKQQQELKQQWRHNIRINYEDDIEGEDTTEVALERTKRQPSTSKESFSRASPSTFPRCSARASQSPKPQAWTPVKNVSESKPKKRHGGIYSLLLKNKPPEHEPTLVDEKRSPQGPEVSPMPHSVSKKSSPPSFAKLQHGGIYGMLRRNSKNEE